MTKLGHPNSGTGDENPTLGDGAIKEVGAPQPLRLRSKKKLVQQKRQRKLESKRSKLRKELFARQDEIEAERNGLIEQLELQLQQQVQERKLFTIEWRLI